MVNTDYQKGALIAGLGVFILSFDALLIRLADTHDWNVAFWRGWLICCAFSLICALRAKTLTFPQTAIAKYQALSVAVIYGINTVLFVYAISHTSTANTVIILASAPLFAALFSRFLLGETLLMRTLLTLISCFIGVLIIFADSLQSTHWRGDMAALLLAISTGGLFTLLRRTQQFSLLPVIAASGAVAGLIATPFATPFSLNIQNYSWLAIMGLVQIPLATWLIMRAPRYLPAPEVSLFLLIQTLLGPVWVWLVVNEPLAKNTALGGAIMLTALFINGMISLRAGRKSAHSVVKPIE